MKQLFLCEKPSQARDIANVLGVQARSDGYISGNDVAVTWCFGHLLETAPPEAYNPAFSHWQLGALPIAPVDWQLKPRDDAKKQLRIIKNLLSKAAEVVVATDADREGEVIAREVLDQYGWSGPISRLWLSALDPASIKKALADIRPGESTVNLYYAGLARSRADWLIGMNLTRAFTVVNQLDGGDGVLSVGRVQTPTLALVVERDHAIENFKPIPFFTVSVTVVAQGGQFSARWRVPEGNADADGRCLDQSVAEAVAKKLANAAGRVVSAETTRKKESAPLLFDLAALQQEGSARFGFDTKQVLSIAQALYETHKATSYPRTDCGFLPESQLADAPQVLGAMAKSDPSIASLIGNADARRRSRAWNDAKITAHHGIIPTSATVDMSAMSPQEQKLYDLIRRRYLAQFFPDHEYDDTQIAVQAADEILTARGRVSIVAGWHEVLRPADNEAGDKAPLPSLTGGEAVQITDPRCETKQTKPPARFTDGTLIAAMKSIARLVTDPAIKKRLKDTAGIGTEATRANIIEVLIDRKLLLRKKEGRKKVLVSSKAGRSLVQTVPAAVRDPSMTALWEQFLEEIAAGRADSQTFLLAQEQFVTNIVSAMQAEYGGKEREATQPCPVCSRPLVRRVGKKGHFWGCSGYPGCEVTIPDKDGKPGNWSPRRDQGGKPKAAEGMPCPDCDDGEITRRTFAKGKSKGKPFLSCSNYPDCQFFDWP